MSSTPASLRDLYNPSPGGWTFLPPPPGFSQQISSPPSSYRFPGHGASSDKHRPQVEVGVELIRSLLLAAAAQYASTALAMPIEIGKMLSQVQWVPREDGLSQDENKEEEEEEGKDADETSESSDDAYFTDPEGDGARRRRRPGVRLRQADEQGYVLRGSVLDDATRPEYVIPVGTTGVWDMIKRVGWFKGEGWLSLFKGLLTTCIEEVLSSMLQPLLHHAIHSAFFPSAPDFEAPMFLPVISHMLTAVILSPVDLVRTRLIVQSSMERYRTYRGPIDALKQILAQEGGWRGVYFHPHLLYPAVLEGGLRAMVSLWVPYWVGGEAGTRMGLLGELVTSSIASLVTSPVEMVRRRLQVQRRGVGKLRTCVETRPGGYEGMMDCALKTIQEEKQGLYRGLSVRVGASLIVFFLGFLGLDGINYIEGSGGGSHGWAEL